MPGRLHVLLGAAALLGGGLRDGGQAHRPGQVVVVDADHADVLRYPQPGLAEHGQRAHRHLVGHGEQPQRRRRRCEHDPRQGQDRANDDIGVDEREHSDAGVGIGVGSGKSPIDDNGEHGDGQQVDNPPSNEQDKAEEKADGLPAIKRPAGSAQGQPRQKFRNESRYENREHRRTDLDGGHGSRER